MTPLDEALVKIQEDPKNIDAKHAYYELFLNSSLFVPTYDEETGSVAKGESEDQLLPLIMHVDGIDYMVMFDTEQRVVDWAEEEVHCLELPGYVIAEMSSEGLHWGLNVGTEYQKQFIPEEIALLKDVVKHSNVARRQKAED